MKKTQRMLFMLLMAVLALGMVTPVQAATVKLNKTKATIYVGDLLTLKLTGTAKKAVWSTSNKKVATVKSGKVTAKKKGTATITAKLGNQEYTCKVTVKNKTLKLEKSSMEIIQYYSNYCRITVPANVKKITASSGDTKIAIAGIERWAGGDIVLMVYGVTPGSATITVTAGSEKKKVQVTVKEHEEFLSYDEFAFTESESKAFEDDGYGKYTNYVDLMVAEYKKTGNLYSLSQSKDDENDENDDNAEIIARERGIQIGSTLEQVNEAYNNVYDYCDLYDEEHEWFVTMKYIEPTTGIIFYKGYVLDNDKEHSVIKIIWGCYALDSECELT